MPDNSLHDNQFELIFDEIVEGPLLEKTFHGDYEIGQNIGKIEEDAEVYENDGFEEWDSDPLRKDD